MEILLIVLLVLIVLGFPSWPHSASWGYGPSGILTVILVIFLIFFLIGRV